MIVVWTRTAKKTFLAETDFILRKWNKRQVKAFVQLVDECLGLLSSGTLKGRKVEYDLFLFVISKQTTLYYLRKDDKIILQVFWNNKRDPEDLRYLLNKNKKP
jgi:plasmid stabilization system protein ParE